MHFHAPDPAFIRSELLRERFRLAIRLSLGFVALLWVVHLLGWGLDLQRFGVRPRDAAGLIGIFAAPLLHAGLAHLLANSLPLVILGTTMLQLYPHSALKVLPAIYLGPGVAVWLLARGGNHIGASGLVYGLVAYICVAGLLRRDRRALAASILVAFLYGASVWGVLPLEDGVSWETHLAATLIGLGMAVLYRHTDIPPRVQYSWELEAQQARDDDAFAGDGMEPLPLPEPSRATSPSTAQWNASTENPATTPSPPASHTLH